MEKKEFVGKVKNGSHTIRLRTWTLSVAIIGAIILYFLVQVGFDNEVNFVDLLFLSTIQIVVHLLYFPDGDLFGQKAPVYVSNKNTYNDKATEITENGRLPISYDAVVSAVSKAITEQEVLSVVFVLEWGGE